MTEIEKIFDDLSAFELDFELPELDFDMPKLDLTMPEINFDDLNIPDLL